MNRQLSDSTAEPSGDGEFSLFVAIVNIVNIVIMGIVSLIVCGVVLRILWGWFIVPIFNIPGLTFSQAIGLVLIVAFLRGGSYSKKPELETDMKKLIRNDLVSMGKPLIVLALGYVAHLSSM